MPSVWPVTSNSVNIVAKNYRFVNGWTRDMGCNLQDRYWVPGIGTGFGVRPSVLGLAEG